VNPTTDRQQHLRAGRRLEYFTLGWNLTEAAAVALGAGVFAASIALIGFGTDFSHRKFVRRDFTVAFVCNDAVLHKYATSRSDRHQRRARNDMDSASINSTAARRVLLSIGSARLKFVAEFLIKTEKEDLMKYLLLIATLAACISTATATSPAADCCKGNAKCCPGKCCKK
jgi:hypothetical protein